MHLFLYLWETTTTNVAKKRKKEKNRNWYSSHSMHLVLLHRNPTVNHALILFYSIGFVRGLKTIFTLYVRQWILVFWWPKFIEKIFRESERNKHVCFNKNINQIENRQKKVLLIDEFIRPKLSISTRLEKSDDVIWSENHFDHFDWKISLLNKDDCGRCVSRLEAISQKTQRKK